MEESENQKNQRATKPVCSRHLQTTKPVWIYKEFTRNAKHGFNSWKWSNLYWNSSSSITIYISILPLCGLQLPLIETHWFSFRHWETDRMLLTVCVSKNFNFLLGRQLA